MKMGRALECQFDCPAGHTVGNAAEPYGGIGGITLGLKKPPKPAEESGCSERNVHGLLSAKPVFACKRL